MELETDVVSHASGSSRLRLANTDILVGVKTEIDTPISDYPKWGKIDFFVDWYVKQQRTGDTSSSSISSKKLTTMLTTSSPYTYFDLKWCGRQGPTWPWCKKCRFVQAFIACDGTVKLNLVSYTHNTVLVWVYVIYYVKIIFISSSANAAPAFEGRGGERLANSISNLMQRAYHSSQAFDLQQLCILKGKQCWKLYVDILVCIIFVCHITGVIQDQICVSYCVTSKTIYHMAI